MRQNLLVPIALMVLVQGGAAQQPQTQAVRSPEVLPDRRVTFRLMAPKATEVRVTCECAEKPQPLRKDERGLWSVTVGPVEPDIYEYDFNVDGVVMPDPRNIVLKYNSRPGPASSLLEVPGSSPMFYDVRNVPHGTVDIRWYHSKATNSVRRLHVYTPPGYDRGSNRLPVLYLLHGADGDDSVWTSFGRANQILDNLMAGKKVAPMIVVMPFGYAYPPSGADTGDQRADFEKDLLESIIPFVQANYRVLSDRNHRAVVGLSMGGGQALSIGLNHLDVFSHVGGMSAAVSRTPETAFKQLAADAKKTNNALKLLWFACGTSDGLIGASRNFATYLKTNSITHTFVETPGAHTWIVWRKYLHEIAPKLFTDRMKT